MGKIYADTLFKAGEIAINYHRQDLIRASGRKLKRIGNRAWQKGMLICPDGAGYIRIFYASGYREYYRRSPKSVISLREKVSFQNAKK